MRFETEPESLLGGLLALARRGVLPTDSDDAPLSTVRRGLGRLTRIDPTALREDVDRLLVSEAVVGALRWMEACGALGALLPEVQALIGFHQSSPRPHKDLWEHTLVVVGRVEPDVTLRWVALCHDIGKVATRATSPDGTLIFHRHEAHGAWLFQGIAGRLRIDEKSAETIAFVIEHHARTNQFDTSWSDRALLRLMRECGEHLPLMLAFSRADWTTKQRHRQVAIATQQDELERRLLALARPAATWPGGLSEALMEATGRAPGPWLGEARRWVLGQIEGGAEVADAARWVERWVERGRG